MKHESKVLQYVTLWKLVLFTIYLYVFKRLSFQVNRYPNLAMGMLFYYPSFLFTSTPFILRQ